MDRFKLLVDSVSDDALVLLDRDGRIESWNPGAERLFGYAAPEIVGQPLARLYPADDVEAGKPDAQLRGAQASGRVQDEGWRLRKDGKRFLAASTLTVLRPAEGRLLGYSLVARDVTERRSEELKLRQELDDYVAFASHDLQEPLRKMASFASLLQRDYHDKLGPEADRYIATIVQAAARLRRLITDLLSYARIGRGDRLPAAPSDFAELVGFALADIEEAVREAGAVVELGELPSLRVHPIRITQLFQNLISNAVKFRSEDRPPKVVVTADRRDGTWVFCVADNGIGFEPDQLERIFVPFKRLHPRGAYPGSGLGLAACKRIVEMHGGRIWAESKPRVGATFYFTLPVDEKPPAD